MSTISIRPGKGQKFSACICEYNIDITAGGCSVATSPKTGEYVKGAACSYCYAGYLHRSYVKEKIVKESVWEKALDTMRINVIRIGKNSEPGALPHREILKEVLRLNNKYNCKSILISKLLDFDSDIAELIKVHNSTIHFSLGNPANEVGPVKLWGSTNWTRTKFADDYRKTGADVWVRPTEDIALPMPNYISDPLNKYPKLNVLITPLRYRKKAIFPADWDAVRSGLDSRYYYDIEEKAIAPMVVHDDWKPYINNTCGKVKDKMLCNLCGLKNIQINSRRKKELYNLGK